MAPLCPQNRKKEDFPEGRELYRLHRAKSVNRTLVEKAKLACLPHQGPMMLTGCPSSCRSTHMTRPGFTSTSSSKQDGLPMNVSVPC